MDQDRSATGALRRAAPPQSSECRACRRRSVSFRRRVRGPRRFRLPSRRPSRHSGALALVLVVLALVAGWLLSLAVPAATLLPH